jgi:hypothetical protein
MALDLLWIVFGEEGELNNKETARPPLGSSRGGRDTGGGAARQTPGNQPHQVKARKGEPGPIGVVSAKGLDSWYIHCESLGEFHSTAKDKLRTLQCLRALVLMSSEVGRSLGCPRTDGAAIQGGKGDNRGTGQIVEEQYTTKGSGPEEP